MSTCSLQGRTSGSREGEPYSRLNCPRQHYDILSALLHLHPILQSLAILFPGLSPTFIFPETPHCSFYTGWVLDRNCPKGCVMMEMFYFCLALSSRVDVAIKHLKNNYWDWEFFLILIHSNWNSHRWLVATALNITVPDIFKFSVLTSLPILTHFIFF